MVIVARKRNVYELAAWDTQMDIRQLRSLRLVPLYFGGTA